MNAVIGATILFTALALAAVLMHLRYVLEVYRDRQVLRTPEGYQLALQAAHESGTTVLTFQRSASRAFNVELSRMIINLIVAAIGIFSLVGIYTVLWILFLVPIISMVSSWLNLKDRWRPKAPSS